MPVRTATSGGAAAQTVSAAAILDADDGFVVAGAHEYSTLEKLAGRLSQIYLDEYFTVRAMRQVSDIPYEQYGIPPTYLEALQQPFKSSNYHLQQGGSRWEGVTVIDWWTFLGDGVRQQVADALFEQFVDSHACAEVTERGDISVAFDEAFPLVGQNGVDAMLEDRVWEHLKAERQQQLSAYSRRAITNGENGQAFEELFEQLCADSGLRCYKRSGRAFARHLPDSYRTVKAENGGITGIPDFFVDKGNTHTLGSWMPDVANRQWEPDGRYAFVECKYNDSHLSPEQRKMVQCLTDQGIEVYLFRGTTEEFQFVSVADS